MSKRLLNEANILVFMAAQQEYGPNLRKKTKVVITGVGPIEAATTTALHLQNLVAKGEEPDFVLSLGSAASATKPVGSVWQVSTVAWRDMDASKLGFAKGVTPFVDLPAALPLVVSTAKVPTATLYTGGKVVGAEDFRSIQEDLADMETFAVVRVCSLFSIPVIGLRGVSDGAEPIGGAETWEKKLALLDQRLSEVYDVLIEAQA